MKPPIRQRKPNRMPRYNYSTRGCYFVTICVKSEATLGTIAGGKIVLSSIGDILEKCWLEIPDHFSQIRLDEFIIMPDHMHGIVVIQEEVGNANLRSLQTPNMNRSKMLLSKVIQNFKAAVTREANKSGSYQAIVWQKSFYDHIIHSYKELIQVRHYIQNNPKHWLKENEEFEKVIQ